MISTRNDIAVASIVPFALGKRIGSPALRRRGLPLAMFAAVLIAASTVGIWVPSAAAREIRVEPGQSIQAAVDVASPGDRVMVQPGIYREPGRYCPTQPGKLCAVVVVNDDISLIAEPRPGRPVILESLGRQEQGIAFARLGVTAAQCLNDPRKHIRGAKVSGFTVRNFDGTGIFLFCVDGWAISSNTTVDNKLYGIFPIFSGNGWINRNLASGAHDTGIYVGQSHDIRVSENVVHDNVSGFEIENSQDVQLDHNESYNNTAGILMFILPGDELLVSRRNRIHKNYVHDNNKPNSCLVPGDDVCLVPPGIGISIAAGDNNVISDNRVARNRTIGILLTDACTAFRIPAASCNLGFDPLPETTRVERNAAQGNGFSPTPGLPGADLWWTGGGAGNCALRNSALLVPPPDLPACLASTDERS